MCRTAHALLQTVICGIQMLVRVFMTVILMIENLIRMILQTLYNFISFMLQMISLIPICVVFLLTARLKCFMCGGGGPCPVNRGGTCDCLMSAVAIIILFLIFRATGVLDKIFYKLGYVKARPQPFTRFVPTPGDITECSRNDTDADDVTDERTARTVRNSMTSGLSPSGSMEGTSPKETIWSRPTYDTSGPRWTSPPTDPPATSPTTPYYPDNPPPPGFYSPGGPYGRRFETITRTKTTNWTEDYSTTTAMDYFTNNWTTVVYYIMNT